MMPSLAGSVYSITIALTLGRSMADLSFPESAQTNLAELEKIPDASIQNPHYLEDLTIRLKNDLVY